MLEKQFETKVVTDISKEKLWEFFSDIENLTVWNPNFSKYNCSCSSDDHHSNLFMHFDLDRNVLGSFKIQEIEREDGKRLKFSVENILYPNRNYNNFEFVFDEQDITFIRYLNFSVFDTTKYAYWYKHFKEHHDSIIASLEKLTIKDGIICKE
jgi:hypothetical protein